MNLWSFLPAHNVCTPPQAMSKSRSSDKLGEFEELEDSVDGEMVYTCASDIY